MGVFIKTVYNPLLSQPFISLALTSLTLLLLVLVLLSVPGPIKGMYWFSVQGEGDGPMSAGVLGWCMTDTSNCTYAPLSENAYLSTMIDTGEALTVRIMLPLACYWMIVVFVTWICLTIATPIGYRIRDLDSITRHLRFAVAEACVLCVSLFGNVLCWLAFGLGRAAYLSIERGGGKPKSGHAMETTAVAAVMSLLSLGTAVWGLHLRLKQAQSHWRDEAVMVRRRSMALFASGAVRPEDANALASLGMTEGAVEKRGSKRWSSSSEVPGYPQSSNGLQHRGSMVKATYSPETDPEALPAGEEEEQIDAKLAEARRNSMDQEMILRRQSVNDSPYAVANGTPRPPN
ncbi:hypothetical protein L198_00835 [Cryptococcus wingfieldii CBS 7118]|uniref:Uncharacterized protein n=1 Tax=Cryptococcus wingfieldii CBS 7118 TaxID=1295528 RepID=A0A1E3K2M1_9TREE|nr:hypothetical protein L198_00835 [Cryptococcus wingfieldii CBS 7118]ODO07256.1 hypothetical protein L198_00835 [Cryptococcus wingfieldii CBS 7118]